MALTAQYFGPRLHGESVTRLGIACWDPDSVPSFSLLRDMRTFPASQSVPHRDRFLSTDIWLTLSLRHISLTVETIMKQRMIFIVQDVARTLGRGVHFIGM